MNWNQQRLNDGVEDKELTRLHNETLKCYLMHALGNIILLAGLSIYNSTTKDLESKLKYITSATIGIAAIVFNKKLYDNRTKCYKDEFLKYAKEMGYTHDTH